MRLQPVTPAITKPKAKKGLEIIPAQTVAGIKIPATKALVCLKCSRYLATVQENETVKCPQCQANHAWIKPSTLRRMSQQARRGEL